MKLSIRKKDVVYLIIATILICVLITIYCIIDGQTLSQHMNDTIFFLAFAQSVVAIIIGITLAIIKKTRKSGLWFIIPFILLVFAFSYDFIVKIIYPCC